MSRTVSFYNYAFVKNGQATDIQLIDFVSIVQRIPWNKRLRVINGYPTGMFEVKKIKISKDYKFLAAAIGKFRRDYKPFLGDLSTQSLEKIEGDVVEIVYVLIDLKYQVVLLEYNQHGIRAGSLEEYFSSFLPHQPNEDWRFNLIPIFSKKGLGDIAGSDQVRAIELKLKLSKFEEQLISSKPDQSNELISFLFNSQKASLIDARTVRIEFGAGQSKTHTMNIDSVMNLLHLLNIDSEAIETLKVRFKDGKTQKMDTVDLKNSGGQIKERIFESETYAYPTTQLVGHAMANKYIDNLGTVEETWRSHRKRQKSIGLPEIIMDPPQEYIVETDTAVNE